MHALITKHQNWCVACFLKLLAVTGVDMLKSYKVLYVYWTLLEMRDFNACPIYSKMIIDKRCVMCESGAGEGVEHLLVTYGEFGRDRWVLVIEVSRIVGAGEWLVEFGRVQGACDRGGGCIG